MSIFASMAAPSDDLHAEGCAFYVEISPGVLEFSSDPCNWWSAGRPLVYQDSHVLPADTDPRGGCVDLAAIPKHVRFWRDNPNAPTMLEPDGHEPFLRFGVNESTVILTRRHVEQIHSEIGSWLAESTGHTSR